MQFFLPFPTIHQQKPSSSPTAEQVRHLNKCQAWTTAWVNAGCVMIKDATGEMCSAAPCSSGVQPALCRWAEGPSTFCACGARNNSNAPLAPRWIQISERRGLQATVLIPSLEDPCVDPIDVELPRCQQNTLCRRHSAACCLTTRANLDWNVSNTKE